MIKMQCLLDIASLLSDVVLSVCAIVALKQIFVSKEQIKMQKEEFLVKSKRESLAIASDQIRYYSNEVIPLVNKVNELIAKEDIKFFKKNKVVLKKDTLSCDNFDINDEDTEKLKKNLNELIELTNKMDDFSIYFTSNLADMDFAFSVLGELFCNEVEDLLPFYILTEGGNNTPAMQLYIKWKKQIEMNNLKRQKMTIEKRLADYMK